MPRTLLTALLVVLLAGGAAAVHLEPPDIPVIEQTASAELRVLLYRGPGPVTVSSPEGVLVGDPPRLVFPALQLPGDLGEEGSWELRAPGSEPLALGQRRYRGRFHVKAEGGHLWVVNHLPLEDYLRGVVPRELLSPSLEAVKAQAVLSRTYALARLGSSELWDLEASSKHQVYGGVEAEHPVSDRAVAETAGLVLAYGEELARQVVYHSTCGGHTEDNERVFPGCSPVPYLRGVSCDDCRSSPYYRWEVSWSPERLGREIARILGKSVGPILRLEPLERSPSGRVLKLRAVGETGEAVLRGDDLRRVLRLSSGKTLYSTRFEMVGPLRARGAGWGHGVGMCQWGAIGKARKGKGFREILEHYFPGARVARRGELQIRSSGGGWDALSERLDHTQRDPGSAPPLGGAAGEAGSPPGGAGR